MNRKILIFLLAGALLGIAGSKWYSLSKATAAESAESTNVENTVSTPIESDKENDVKIPAKVYDILKYVETFHEPKDGYVGGRKFHNYEGLLPINRPNGNPIHYREWDVNPKKGFMKRGKERLITGDNKSAWYTDNHYKSFIKIK
ncbi:MAG: ribonuclease domain-containing protein [Bacteroidia bacterium]